MKKVFWFYFLTFSGLITLFIGSCKKDKDDNPPAITQEQIQAIKTGYTEVAVTLDEALLSDDPVTAFYQSLDAIKTKTAVENAWNDSTSFFVKFEHGGIVGWTIVTDIYTPESESSPKENPGVLKGKGNPVLVGNKDVCLINQQYSDESRPHNLELIEHLSQSFSDKGFLVTVRNGEEASIDYIKKNLSDFGTIFYISHGGYDHLLDLTWILTGEVAGSLPIDSIIHKYYNDWIENKLAIISCKEEINGKEVIVPFYSFSEEFINAEFPDGIFPKSMIYLVACQGLMDADREIAGSLVKKGAGVVIGWTYSNCKGQSTGRSMFDYLLDGFTCIETINELLTMEQIVDNCTGYEAYLTWWPLDTGGDYCLINNRPEIVTTPAFQITETSATTGGNIISDAGLPVLARGVCYSRAPNPTIFNDTTLNGSGTGEFRSYLKGLDPLTDYYVRAYATNSKMTSYGDEIIFKTKESFLASVTTYAVSESNVYKNFAICGGNVTNTGGAPVTERGICWDTQPNPTIFNNKLPMGTGQGGFWDTISGLLPLTTYHIRAYAVNFSGVSYGADVEFTTKQHALGDTYGGGIIAYFWTEMDPGYVPGEQHGLIVAPSDQASDALWGCYGTPIHGTSPDNAAGPANTLAIVTACNEPGIAARLCHDLVLNGYDDWFLPSSYALAGICAFKDIIGGFSAGNYWTSTNYAANMAETIDFPSGCLIEEIPKNAACFVRAAREF